MQHRSGLITMIIDYPAVLGISNVFTLTQTQTRTVNKDGQEPKRENVSKLWTPVCQVKTKKGMEGCVCLWSRVRSGVDSLIASCCFLVWLALHFSYETRMLTSLPHSIRS